MGDNMKKVLLGIVFCLILLFSYLIYTFANNNTTTYIEYACNSDFIIGINKDNHISHFIPLNELATQKYNLNLIEEKSLFEFGELYEELEKIKDKEVKVTIITKNTNYSSYLYSKIAKSLEKHDVELVEPSYQLLTTYSNEVLHNVGYYQETYFKENINTYLEEVKVYIDKVLYENELLDEDLTPEKIEILNNLINDDTFNSYQEIDLGDENITITNSKYEVVFNIHETSFEYTINYYLDCHSKKIFDEYEVLEEYNVTYDGSYTFNNNNYRYKLTNYDI